MIKIDIVATVSVHLQVDEAWRQPYLFIAAYLGDSLHPAVFDNDFDRSSVEWIPPTYCSFHLLFRRPSLRNRRYKQTIALEESPAASWN
jgi:hypothetical protein